MKQGALIHKKDRNGDPPLVCAVLANNLEVVRLLVQVRDPFPLDIWQYVCGGGGGGSGLVGGGMGWCKSLLVQVRDLFPQYVYALVVLVM